MRQDHRKTVTVLGRKFDLWHGYTRCYDVSALWGRSVIDRSAALRVLGFGVVLQSHQSTRSWCVSVGHSWLLDLSFSGTFDGPRQPSSLSEEADYDLYGPHVAAGLTMLGTINKAQFSWRGFKASSFLKIGDFTNTVRWGHRFG